MRTKIKPTFRCFSGTTLAFAVMFCFVSGVTISGVLTTASNNKTNVRIAKEWRAHLDTDRKQNDLVTDIVRIGCARDLKAARMQCGREKSGRAAAALFERKKLSASHKIALKKSYADGMKAGRKFERDARKAEATPTPAATIAPLPAFEPFNKQ